MQLILIFAEGLAVKRAWKKANVVSKSAGFLSSFSSLRLFLEEFPPLITDYVGIIGISRLLLSVLSLFPDEFIGGFD